ncbi:putative dehydrogenase [Fontibacillus phaseoli]|uniref:Putative dehydrogenase n=1 Tax=Fontibacillus phaseoli TaxID=1416533 RepID=A0A369BAQ6_9BACL|nr:Gfo/Idh/MocA family oxidoreductase [Fontibacillus phaseoli]RCX18610.1 putative dehydrogenase [Fontibacillus phaseoli]
MRDQIGSAIVGAGAISPLHADSIAKLNGVHLKMMVDNDPGKAAEAAEKYHCEAAGDMQTLLDREDIQVVHLCTPHHLHAGMAIGLLRSGKHVLTEKPMAHHLHAAEALLREASRSPAQLGIAFQNRYNASSRKIREIIDAGTLGRLLGLKGIVTWDRGPAYYTSSPWRGRWATEGGGVLINQAIHTLDLLQWFGGEVASIHGSASTDALGDTIEVEDTAHAHIRFTNGARALFYATNAYVSNSPVELELVFEQGVLQQRNDCLHLIQHGCETLLCEPPITLDEQGLVTGKSYWGTSHQLLIEDFYDHVRSGTRFPIHAGEGIKTLRLIADLYASSQAQATEMSKRPT